MNLLLMDWLPPGLASSSASSSGMLVPADPGENGVRSDAIMMAHLAMVTAMVSYTSVGVEPAPTIVKVLWNGSAYDTFLPPRDDVGLLLRQVVSLANASNIPQVTVANMVDQHGQWKWDECYAILTRPIFHKLASSLPPRSTDLTDTLGWRWTT
ncbi:hypothetical protein V6N13_148787 [Hibiscus sabdariffa]